MQIKRFEAKNMTAALRMIKGELGPEAVILSARSLRKGKGFLGSMRYAGVEVTAAVDASEATLNTPRIPAAKPVYRTSTDRPPVDGDPSSANKRATSGNLPDPLRPYPNRQSRRNMRSPGSQRALSCLYQHILAQGVDRGLASELIDEIKRIPAFEDLVRKGEFNEQIGAILQEMGVCADKTALSAGKPNMVALIGATGVGKTTTIAKLAAIQARQRRKQVALISIDNYGIAANQQLKAYARILGLPIQCAVNPAELRKAIKKVKHHDLILIDTPGINPTDPHCIRELNAYFAKLPNLRKLLVVSSATKERDLIELGHTITTVGIRCMIFTKLDESRTHGNMLNLVLRNHLPVAYFCSGRKVSEDLEEGSVQKLVDLIFKTGNQFGIFKDGASTPSTDTMTGTREASDKRSYFVANRNSDVYHATDCKWSYKIKPENIIHFSSIKEAEAQHFLPCRSCNPDRAKRHQTEIARTAKRTFTSYL
jgi:flagellar biosynthesis protein FlhF